MPGLSPRLNRSRARQTDAALVPGVVQDALNDDPFGQDFIVDEMARPNDPVLDGDALTEGLERQATY